MLLTADYHHVLYFYPLSALLNWQRQLAGSLEAALKATI